MKLVAILGSPHGMTGATGLLLDGVLQGARDAGAEVQTFSLTELTVQPCRGCDTCHISGECPIDDDYRLLRDAMLSSDGLILASPNYIQSVTAQLKAVLDRCCGLLHLQAIQDKYAAAVVTSGGPGSDEVEHYLLRFLRSLGYATVGSVGALGWQMMNEQLRAGNLDAAKKLGATLVQAIQTKPHFSDQDAERQAFMERMRQLVEAQKSRWPHEYQYWATYHGL